MPLPPGGRAISAVMKLFHSTPDARDDAAAVEAIRRAAAPLQGTDDDERAILASLGEASLVLLGEATHGTQEFYAARARLTQRLIAEHEFSAIAVEGDWPDAYRVN